MRGALSPDTFNDIRRILVTDWDNNKWYIGGILIFTYYVWPLLMGSAGMGRSAYATQTYFRV